MIVVTELTMTCPSFPSQWEGRTADGRHVYVRYRSGCLRIGVDRLSVDAAVEAAMSGDPVHQSDDRLDGELTYARLRDLTRGAYEWPV